MANKIEELEKRLNALNEELQKSNMIANKNLPLLVKSFFVFLFFLIMSFLKPDLVIKIIQMILNSFGAEALAS
jgi:hypothetical protein